jgi:hypothetical protein
MDSGRLQFGRRDVQDALFNVGRYAVDVYGRRHLESTEEVIGFEFAKVDVFVLLFFFTLILCFYDEFVLGGRDADVLRIETGDGYIEMELAILLYHLGFGRRQQFALGGEPILSGAVAVAAAPLK